ncbi:MAG: hypothetical protein ACR2L1_02170 [Pyrinomonadaceae bacterium]
MPEVLDIQQAKNRNSEIADDAFSWKVELPETVKKENNLSENSYLVLTVHNGKINGELINVTPEIKNEANRITGKYRKAFEELKRLGD